MRRLLYFSVFALLTILIMSCGDSSTGPDSEETTTYTVSVDMAPSDAGTVSPSTEETYEEGKEIQLLASPGDDYVFTGWTGDMEGEVNPLPLTVSQDFNLTANFELKNYDLTTNIEGEGAIQENVLQQKTKEYEHGTVVELIATPAKGYKFVEWKGDIEGTANPVQDTVDTSKEITAVFEKKSYELAVTTKGSGAVSEQVVSKAKDYEYRDVVELMPSAAEGWEFVEWNGDLSGSDVPAQITVDTAKAVTAVFERKTFAFEIDTTGKGTIQKDPQQNEYKYGDEVTLTAEPASNWAFKEWAGEISGTTPEITVTVRSEPDITAVFEKKPLFYLAENGYTVVCPEAEPGQKGYLNGDPSAKAYKAVDRAVLEKMVSSGKDVTGVCTSHITDMSKLFEGKANFNQAIGNWDVSNVINMSGMFDGAASFNQDIGSWNVSNVKSMRSMFYGASSFNGDLSSWDVSSVTGMGLMFEGATSFNGPLNSWDVSSVTRMERMFYRATSFNKDLSNWDVRSVTNMLGMFGKASSFNKDLSNWNVSNVTNMRGMFTDASDFNGDISSWDVSSVENMYAMFEGANSFNQDISSWDVSSVTDMGLMFEGATSFNGPLNSWNVSNVTRMKSIFEGATSFNKDISNWDVSGVTNMFGMFRNASSFNKDLNSWDVSNVTSMKRMFLGASNFTGDISSWDVSNVTSMKRMFLGASNFTGDISSWDVSSVTNMRQMFHDAFNFNGDLSSWDVSSVKNMNSMFFNASNFNGDISNWDVSSVTNMEYMFFGASSFNQDISGWCVSQINSKPTDFDTNAGFDGDDTLQPDWGTCP